ncbi:MAG: hypothetical protein WAP74_03185 [Patescibacteria group bacterium]
MARKQAVIEEPVIVKVGKCGEFEVTYRRFAGDEGPAAEFFGFVDGNRVKLLRFDDFKNDPHYHYHPDTPDDKKYSLDPVFFNTSRGLYLDFYDIMSELPAMVKAAGEPALAKKIHRESSFGLNVQDVIDAMNQLRRQEQRKAKRKAAAK